MAGLAIGGLLLASSLHAQFTAGVGAGGAFGTRGGSGSLVHGLAFAEFKVPVLPGVRADAMVMDTPSGVGPLSLALSVVWSAPIPVVKPYVLGGWGKYGIGKDGSVSGWNVGLGIRASLGVGIFVEARRHQKIGRDLITAGITF
jgi:hypothetical protein